MNSSQFGSILNRVFTGLPNANRRAFSDEGRRRTPGAPERGRTAGPPPRPLKRSSRRSLPTPMEANEHPENLRANVPGVSRVEIITSHDGDAETRSPSRPSSCPSRSSQPGNSTKRRPRSLYSPRKPERNTVHDRNASLETTTKNIMQWVIYSISTNFSFWLL